MKWFRRKTPGGSCRGPNRCVPGTPPKPPRSRMRNRQPPEPPPPIHRRELYRQLAAARKALRAWELLRPVFGTSAESLATPSEVLLFIRAARRSPRRVSGYARHRPSLVLPAARSRRWCRLPHVIHAAFALWFPNSAACCARLAARITGSPSTNAVAAAGNGEAADVLESLAWLGGYGVRWAALPEWLLLFAFIATLQLASLLRRNP